MGEVHCLQRSLSLLIQDDVKDMSREAAGFERYKLVNVLRYLSPVNFGKRFEIEISHFGDIYRLTFFCA